MHPHAVDIRTQGPVDVHEGQYVFIYKIVCRHVRSSRMCATVGCISGLKFDARTLSVL